MASFIPKLLLPLYFLCFVNVEASIELSESSQPSVFFNATTGAITQSNNSQNILLEDPRKIKDLNFFPFYSSLTLLLNARLDRPFCSKKGSSLHSLLQYCMGSRAPPPYETISFLI